MWASEQSGDSHTELVLGRHVRGLATVAKKLLDEVGDVLSGDGDMLD